MAEVESDIELDQERRAQVDAYFSAIDGWDHYEALDVSREATREEIRKAYFALSKRFHPDTLFGKNLGPYKARMEAVFQRVTDAYEILGRTKKRYEYDRYLEARGEVTQTPVNVSVGPSPGADTRGKTRKRRIREHYARQLARMTGREMPQKSQPKPEPTFDGPDDVLQHLGRALKKVSKVTGGQVNREDRYFQEAVEAEQAGETVRAVNLLRLATGLAPDRADNVNLYERLRKEVSGSMTDNFIRQARYEEEHQMWEEAGASWSRVVEGRPDDPDANRRAAKCLARSGGAFRQARQYAQKAIDLDPESAQSHVAMALVFLSAGMRRNATMSLEEACRLDPDDEEAKELLIGLEE